MLFSQAIFQDSNWEAKHAGKQVYGRVSSLRNFLHWSYFSGPNVKSHLWWEWGKKQRRWDPSKKHFVNVIFAETNILLLRLLVSSNVLCVRIIIKEKNATRRKIKYFFSAVATGAPSWSSPSSGTCSSCIPLRSTITHMKITSRECFISCWGISTNKFIE